MTRIVAAIAALAGRLVAPFRPEPGTTEGAVYGGMLLIAIGFAVADLWPLAFLVPGAILVLVGAVPVLIAARRAG